MHPLVTIVTVSYNQAAYLQECLESVLRQKYDNIEYIVIDGGSTDESVGIIERYSCRLAYWHSEKDAGAAAALNRGFGMANGSILAYLNSDDCLKPWAVEEWVAEFHRRPHAEVVYGDLEIIDSDGRPANMPGRFASTFRAAPWSRRSHAAGAVVIPQQAAAWRAAVRDRVGVFNECNRTCWDGEFFAQAAITGSIFAQIPRVLASFRVHSSSISGGRRLQEQFIADERRIQRAWADAGVKISPFERCVRRFILRIYRFARQPSAIR